MKVNKQIRLLDNKGSTLILTLIVFSVILILGMTMATGMLYSQNENIMQMNKQKAYYAAQSAVDAVKSYFLNPNSSFISADYITSPRELVGTTGTYILKEQGIEEETAVVIEIKREGTSIASNKEYILIQATGTCKQEKSTVKLRLLEEKEEGTNLYSEEVVFGSTYLKINHTSTQPLRVQGNIFVDDLLGSDGVNISGIDMTKPREEGPNTLYLNGVKSPVTLQNSKLQDVYVQFSERGIHVNKNEIDNIYIKYSGDTAANWIGTSFDHNRIAQEAQLYMAHVVPAIGNNQVGQRLILGLNMQELPSWKITENEVGEIYIKGAKKLGTIKGIPSKPTEVLYTDAVSYEAPIGVNAVVQRDLSELNAYEEKVPKVMEQLEHTSQVLRDKPSWNKESLSSEFIRLEQGEGPYAPDPANAKYEEYYNPTTKVRLVFANEAGWHNIKVGTSYNEMEWLTYYISAEAMYREDQVFFIAENADGVTFKFTQTNEVGAFYVYAPRALCKFGDNFKYFEGSIIAKQLIIDSNVHAEFVFREPQGLEGAGVPGGSTGQSYKYSFITYFD